MSNQLTMADVAHIIRDHPIHQMTAETTQEAWHLLGPTILAVIWGESAGDAHAIRGPIVKDDPEHPAHLSLDRGLAQINSGWWPQVFDRDAFDPVRAVHWMIDQIFEADSYGEGLSLWAAFNNLTFLESLPGAQGAWNITA